VFARECTPATAWDTAPLRDADTVFCEELSLCAPGAHPLLAQLRAGDDAGFTTVAITVSATGVDVAISRRRARKPQAA
jgi:hypothetical protein